MLYLSILSTSWTLALFIIKNSTMFSAFSWTAIKSGVKPICKTMNSSQYYTVLNWTENMQTIET